MKGLGWLVLTFMLVIFATVYFLTKDDIWTTKDDYIWTVVKVNDNVDRPYSVAACYSNGHCDSLTGYREPTVDEAKRIAADLNHYQNGHIQMEIVK